MGRLGNNTYFAHGYSGHGVTGSHTFGRILSEAVAGDRARFDVFAKVPWYPFPGGRMFRVPYSMMGSWYYALRDRLGFKGALTISLRLRRTFRIVGIKSAGYEEMQ